MGAFEELVSEALAAPFSGWDFSWLAARSTAGRLPWSYQREVAARAAAAGTMLDMGTGGGERLSRLSLRPRRTVATEAWPPNVAVAAARLRPLGIPVVQDEGAPDNTSQGRNGRGRLPFGDGVFALVTSRHEASGLQVPQQPQSWLPLARRQMQDAGLAVETAACAEQRFEFHDIAAAVYYLRVVSWAIPHYSPDTCAAALRAAHDTPGMWPFPVRHRRFLLVATKP